MGHYKVSRAGIQLLRAWMDDRSHVGYEVGFEGTEPNSPWNVHHTKEERPDTISGSEILEIDWFFWLSVCINYLSEGSTIYYLNYFKRRGRKEETMKSALPGALPHWALLFSTFQLPPLLLRGSRSVTLFWPPAPWTKHKFCLLVTSPPFKPAIVCQTFRVKLPPCPSPNTRPVPAAAIFNNEKKKHKDWLDESPWWVTSQIEISFDKKALRSRNKSTSL